VTAPAAIVTSVLLGECDHSSTGLPAAAGIPACANVMPQRDRQCLARGAIVLFFSKGTGMPRPANDLGAIVPFVTSQKVKGETFVARALLNCCGCGFSAFGHGMPCPYCRVGGGDACVVRFPPVLLAPRPCLAAFSASRIAPQCLQTATLGFTFSPQAGQSAKRVGT